MIILVNALSARQGGGQTYLIHLLQHLPNNPAVRIILLAPDSLRIASDDRIVRIKEPSLSRAPVTRALWEKFMLARLVERFDADVLFCPGGVIGGNVRSTCKTVTMFRNMIPFDYEMRRRYKLGFTRTRLWVLRREMLRSMQRADLVIFVSEFARTVIEKANRGALKKSLVIPHGISPEFRVADKEIPQPVGLPQGGYLLYVSILDFYKAQIEVVQGYAKALRRRGRLPALLLVGPEDKEYGHRLRAQIAELGVQDQVLLLGAVPYIDLPALYKNALINIFASESENCPNILLEALAAGRPLLSSSCPPMPEFAQNAALYFDPRSPDDFANGLERLIDDVDLRGELAKKAKERSARFDWAETASATWDAILRLKT